MVCYQSSALNSNNYSISKVHCVMMKYIDINQLWFWNQKTLAPFIKSNYCFTEIIYLFCFIFFFFAVFANCFFHQNSIIIKWKQFHHSLWNDNVKNKSKLWNDGLPRWEETGVLYSFQNSIDVINCFRSTTKFYSSCFKFTNIVSTAASTLYSLPSVCWEVVVLTFYGDFCFIVNFVVISQ